MGKRRDCSRRFLFWWNSLDRTVRPCHRVFNAARVVRKGEHMQILITWTVGARRDPKTTFRMLHAPNKSNAFPVEKRGSTMLNEERWESVNIGDAETNRIRILATEALAARFEPLPDSNNRTVFMYNGRQLTIDLGDVTP